MIRAVIIDDESHSRETIFEILRLYCSNITVVGQAENVKSGIEVIKIHNPDLVLLDIKMPDGTGFDLVRQVDKINFKIIFVTAYEEYAVKAFKFSALDYLLKPIDPEELVLAVGKVSESLDNDNIKTQINEFLEQLSNSRQNTARNKIVLKTAENIHVVEIESIVFLEADQNYSRFHLLDGDSILVSKTMKEYISMLNGHNFYRIHQSYIANLNHVKRYNREENICIMSNGSKIPVSYRKKDELISLFSQL